MMKKSLAAVSNDHKNRLQFSEPTTACALTFIAIFIYDFNKDDMSILPNNISLSLVFYD